MTQLANITGAVDPSESTKPEWLRSLREAGAERFRALGLPGSKDESWRFTSLKALAAIDFEPAAFDAEVSREDVERFAIPELDAVRLVFVNGRFRADLSDDTAALGAGVRCLTLEAATEQDLPELRAHLGTLSRETDDAFTALSNANVDSGVVVIADAGAKALKPIEVLSIATPTERPIAAHPRNLIVAGEGARVDLVEHYVTTSDEAVYLNNAVTEIIAAERAVVHHYYLEKESEAAFAVASLKASLAEKSDVHSHTILLGGAMVRNNVFPRLNGTDCHCLINGLYVGHNRQHMDNAMRVEHNAPGCRSRQFYRGIMNGSATGVFSGRIRVDKPAQQTDAVQNSRSMLLSEKSRVTNRPQLEIYADDVKCTHGATTGRVDDEAVFYFKSRGIAEPVARAMLIYAFAAEQFDRMELVPVRKLLAREMIDKLPQAKGLSIEIA